MFLKYHSCSPSPVSYLHVLLSLNGCWDSLRSEVLSNNICKQIVQFFRHFLHTVPDDPFHFTSKTFPLQTIFPFSTRQLCPAKPFLRFHPPSAIHQSCYFSCQTAGSSTAAISLIYNHLAQPLRLYRRRGRWRGLVGPEIYRLPCTTMAVRTLLVNHSPL